MFHKSFPRLLLFIQAWKNNTATLLISVLFFLIEILSTLIMFFNEFWSGDTFFLKASIVHKVLLLEKPSSEVLIQRVPAEMLSNKGFSHDIIEISIEIHLS